MTKRMNAISSAAVPRLAIPAAIPAVMQAAIPAGATGVAAMPVAATGAAEWTSAAATSDPHRRGGPNCRYCGWFVRI